MTKKQKYTLKMKIKHQTKQQERTTNTSTAVGTSN